MKKLILIIIILLILVSAFISFYPTMDRLLNSRETVEYIKRDETKMEIQEATKEELQISEQTETSERLREKIMKLKVEDKDVEVVWDNNDSVSELKNLVGDSNLSISMRMYGGNEQVGAIGQSIVSNDTNITTKPGDIVLYQGNQIVVFYGSNNWDYTQLGKINLSESELEDLFGNGNVTITLWTE